MKHLTLGIEFNFQRNCHPSHELSLFTDPWLSQFFALSIYVPLVHKRSINIVPEQQAAHMIGTQVYIPIV